MGLHSLRQKLNNSIHIPARSQLSSYNLDKGPLR